MGGDATRPTGEIQDKLLDGLWPDFSPSSVQDYADAAGEVETNAADSIHAYRSAADQLEEYAQGDVFLPAIRGMADTGRFMNDGAGYTTDRQGLAQKIALETQSTQADMQKIVVDGVSRISKARAEGDAASEAKLFQQYRGMLQTRAEQGAQAINAHAAQHEASVPPPQYKDTSNAEVAPTDLRQLAGSGINPARPESLPSYRQVATAPLEADGAAPGSGSPVAAGAPLPSSGAPATSPAAPPAGAAPGGQPPSPGAAPGSGPGQPPAPQSASTRLMGASSAGAAVGESAAARAFSAPGPLAPAPSPVPGFAGAGAAAAPAAPPPVPKSAAPPPVAGQQGATTPAATGQQSPVVSGGGGSGARPAVPAPAEHNAQPRAGADGPGSRAETAGVVAAKEKKDVELQNGVLVPGTDPLQAGLRTAVRTLALQIIITDDVHNLLDLRVAGFIATGGTTNAPRMYVATGAVGGLDYVPPDSRVDDGTQHVRDKTYGAAAKKAKKGWRWLVSDPLWNLLAIAKEIASRPGEEGFRVVHIVTTYEESPHPALAKRIEKLGASFLADRLDRPEDSQKTSEVDIPDTLSHRSRQISPAWAAAEKKQVGKDQARAFAVDLALQVLPLAPDVPAESALYQMVEKIRVGLPVPADVREAVYQVRDNESGRLVGMALEAPPPGEWDDEDGAALPAATASFNFGTTIIAGKEPEPAPAPRKAEEDQYLPQINHWFRRCAAQLVLLLERLDEPGANLARVCLDIAYEAVHATEDAGMVERAMREHRILSDAGQDRAA